MAEKILSLEAAMPIRKALELVGRISADDRNVIFGDHARKRLVERGITPKQVLSILRAGEMEGVPLKGKKKGEWVVTMWGSGRNNRDIKLVTILLQEKTIFIKTVMWKDV